jgi:hypothetical protein
MDYKKASEIRKKGLMTLIAENKFQRDRGLGASITGAISQKFQAKATGMKESLDPLNLIRKITGRGTFGKIATTIAGRALGKSESDISYFGGYGKKAKRPYYKDLKLAPVKYDEISGRATRDPIASILGEMYEFMQKSHEMDELDSEIQKSFLEEQSDEDERRHENLVRAIKKYMKVPTTSTEAKREENSGGGFFDKIMQMWENFKASIDEMIKPILKFLGSTLYKALSAAQWLVGALASPFAMAAALGFATLWKLYNDENSEETNKGLQNALGGTEVPGRIITETVENTTEIERRRENILSERPSSKKSYINPVKEEEHKQKYLEEIGWDNETGLTKKERDNGFTGINEKGQPVKSQSMKKGVEATEKPVESVKQNNSATTSEVKPTSSTTPVPQSTPTPQIIPKSANVDIPTQITPETLGGSSQSEPSVIVNNSSTNVGGAPAKTFNTSSVKTRNDDLNRYLRNAAVPV